MNEKHKALKKKLAPKPTPYDVKHNHEAYHRDSKFFSRSTMKAFGQTMKDFKTSRTRGRYTRISAPSHWDGKYMGTTERVYNPDTHELIQKPSSFSKSLRRHHKK